MVGYGCWCVVISLRRFRLKELCRLLARAIPFPHFLIQPTMALSPSQLEQFERDGVLVLKDFVTKEECDQLRTEAIKLVQDFDASTVSIFSTKSQGRSADEYFLGSGDKVRFFFEENAFDENRRLKYAKELSINKFGHAQHDLNPVFEKFSYQPKIKELVHSLNFYKKPLSVQSMFIFKQPKIGGVVVPHQDSTFLYTNPMTSIGIWFALEDATQENGCLWGIHGSHKDGIATRMVRNKDNTGVEFTGKAKEHDESLFVPLECTKGSCVLLHGSYVHMSKENTSDSSRHAYSLHFIEGDSSVEYPADNWLQRSPSIPFRTI